jgi:putative peptide zinc metalloprotease protein
MSAADQSTTKSAEQAGVGRFPWELRPDIGLTREHHTDGDAWILRDPLRLTFFRTSDAGLDFLSHAASSSSLHDEARRLQIAYPEEDITPVALQQLAAAAVQAGIVRPIVPGIPGSRRNPRHSPLPRLLRRASGLLAFRWRGIDPSPLLRTLYPLTRWLFSSQALLAAVLLMLCSLSIVLLRCDQLLQELPDLQSLITWQNLAAVGTAFLLLRLLHELGHALTCLHFGGECHELGVYFILFMPLLYCDVSDSWRHPRRQQRMAVAAAGIFVELCVAAVCGLLWAWSVPGVLHTLFLNLMLVSSLNTLLVNGNPLIRFDGYYVLSDLLQIPNLWTLARSASAALTERAILGIRLPWHEFGSKAGFSGLAAWGYASVCYRIGLTLTLLSFFYHTLEPAGLQFAAFLPCAAGSVLGVGGAAARLRLLFRQSSTSGRRRMLAGIAVATTLAAALLLTPFSLPIHAPCILSPGTAQPVYAPVNGQLRFAVTENTPVRKGTVLAVLHNEELEFDLAGADGECARLEAALRNVRSRVLASTPAADAIPVAEQALRAARTRHASLQRLAEQLTIRSPADGIVILPRNTPRQPAAPDAFVSWKNQPLQQTALGAWIEARTLLCWIGQPGCLRVDACVEQADVARIQTTGPNRVRFLGSPDLVAHASIEAVSTEPLHSVDRELVRHQLVNVNSPETLRPAKTLFVVTLRPESPHHWGPASLYASGVAQIQARPLSLLNRTVRLLQNTFGSPDSR